jgi:hypothetical protein
MTTIVREPVTVDYYAAILRQQRISDTRGFLFESSFTNQGI